MKFEEKESLGDPISSEQHYFSAYVDLKCVGINCIISSPYYINKELDLCVNNFAMIAKFFHGSIDSKFFHGSIDSNNCNIDIQSSNPFKSLAFSV